MLAGEKKLRTEGWNRSSRRYRYGKSSCTWVIWEKCIGDFYCQISYYSDDSTRRTRSIFWEMTGKKPPHLHRDGLETDIPTAMSHLYSSLEVSPYYKILDNIWVARRIHRLDDSDILVGISYIERYYHWPVFYQPRSQILVPRAEQPNRLYINKTLSGGIALSVHQNLGSGYCELDRIL